MKPLLPFLVLSCLAGATAGCAGQPPLDAKARAVAVDDLAGGDGNAGWRVGGPDDVPGLYTSTAIEGDAAAVLAEVHYRFAQDGSFTGAALVSAPSFAYQVLTGQWHVTDGLLYLSEDGEPARLEVRGDFLRLSSSEGTVILRRRSAP